MKRTRSNLLTLAVALAASAPVPFAASEAPAGRLVGPLLDQAAVVFWRPAGTVLGRVETGEGPRVLAIRGGQLFVANRGLERTPGSTITVVDLATMRKVRDISACAGCAPRGLAFDDRGTLWMTGQAHRAVYRIDAPYEAPAASVLADWGWPTEIALAAGSGRLGVGLRGSPVAALVDVSSMTTSRLDVGPVPEALAARPGAPELWFALNPSGQLAVVDLKTPAKPDITRFGSVPYPQDIAFTPDGKTVLVTSAKDNALHVIDAASREERAAIALGAAPREVAVSPDGAHAAVFLPEPREIVVVALAGGEGGPLAHIAAGGMISDLLWIP
jgi:YVTN family beta-propeller protein